MKLQQPSLAYNRLSEVERNRQLEQADKQNHKRGRDVEIGTGRLILTAPDGTRWAVSVDSSGTLSASPA